MTDPASLPREALIAEVERMTRERDQWKQSAYSLNGMLSDLREIIEAAPDEPTDRAARDLIAARENWKRDYYRIAEEQMRLVDEHGAARAALSGLVEAAAEHCMPSDYAIRTRLACALEAARHTLAPRAGDA